MGSVGAVKPHVEAAKYRAEAAVLRQKLASLESQDVPASSPATPQQPVAPSANVQEKGGSLR
jgi:hypothetical protein